MDMVCCNPEGKKDMSRKGKKGKCQDTQAFWSHTACCGPKYTVHKWAGLAWLQNRLRGAVARGSNYGSTNVQSNLKHQKAMQTELKAMTALGQVGIISRLRREKSGRQRKDLNQRESVSENDSSDQEVLNRSNKKCSHFLWDGSWCPLSMKPDRPQWHGKKGNF